ncbi:hypothetical protein G9A89_008874 [Geosiphon pyriformis]|nr:hypothetical protein G9A89_008874 [Geosiphon pyriformis]
MALAKGFVMKEWVTDTVRLLGPGSDRSLLVVNLVRGFAEGHRSAIWVATAKLRVHYEKQGLLPRDGSMIPVISGLASLWSRKMVRDFGIRLGIHVCFGLHPGLASMYFSFLCDFPVVDGLGI